MSEILIEVIFVSLFLSFSSNHDTGVFFCTSLLYSDLHPWIIFGVFHHDSSFESFACKVPYTIR